MSRCVVLGILHAVFRTPGAPVRGSVPCSLLPHSHCRVDKGQVQHYHGVGPIQSPECTRRLRLDRLRMVFYPVLANRVLLNIRNTTDLRVRSHAVSTLLFAPAEPDVEKENGDEAEILVAN